MKSIFLPLGLAFIMFAIGLGLHVSAFTRLKGQWKALGWGLAAQIIGLPLIALALAYFAALSPVLAVGLLVLAAAPGGITSNYLTMVARGDTALSIVMTIVTSLLAMLTVPLIVGSGLEHFLGASAEISLPVGRTIVTIVLLTGLPLVLGMGFRARFPVLARRVASPARSLAGIVFATIVLLAFWGQWEPIKANWAEVGPAVVGLNAATMAVGFGIAALIGLNIRSAIAITVECGLQNVALAIFIAVQLLQDDRFMIPAVIYALVMNVSILVVIAAGRWLVPAIEEDGLSPDLPRG
ncbi:MAG: bile acid:sodium symporter [Hyphomicrobiales bacterium]|nr:MAG: bile acid:sodium symporter [Hyphomicrobiales bacterium]